MSRHCAAAGSSAMLLWIGMASVIFTTGCGNPGAAESTRTGPPDRSGLHGKVEAYTLYDLTQLERFGKYVVFEDISYPISTCTLSETGKEVESTYYDTFGWPVISDKMVEDANGKETWAKYGYGDNGSVPIEVGGYTTYYGNDESIDSIRGYYLSSTKDRVNWVHTYEYLEPGRKTVISSYIVDSNFVNSSLQWKHIERFRDNRLVEIEHRNNKGGVEWIDKFGYDAKGNKTESSHFLSNGLLDWTEKSKYDKTENEVERARYDSHGHLIHKYIFRYVELPVVTIEDYLKDGESLFLSRGYDPNRSDNNAESFDKQENWTIRLTLEENNRFGYSYLEITEVQKREIQYYE